MVGLKFFASPYDDDDAPALLLEGRTCSATASQPKLSAAFESDAGDAAKSITMRSARDYRELLGFVRFARGHACDEFARGRPWT